jgi:hypothetical protein
VCVCVCVCVCAACVCVCVVCALRVCAFGSVDVVPRVRSKCMSENRHSSKAYCNPHYEGLSL